jgi:hypothetical protein
MAINDPTACRRIRLVTAIREQAAPSPPRASARRQKQDHVERLAMLESELVNMRKVVLALAFSLEAQRAALEAILRIEGFPVAGAENVGLTQPRDCAMMALQLQGWQATFRELQPRPHVRVPGQITP